jgi:hypothetical protein
MNYKKWNWEKVGDFSVDDETKVELLKVDFPSNHGVCEEDIIDWLDENTYYVSNYNVPFGSWYLASVVVIEIDTAYSYAIVRATAHWNV